jgi:hypothetical protein
MVPLRRVTVNRHVTPLAAGSTATVPVNLQTILSIRYKTGRILSCIYRNQSHLLSYVFASSSVKKLRFDGFQSHSLLKFTLFDGMERSGMKTRPY